MKKSFTLIELIVVIAIIAILAAIIAPNAFKAIEKAKIARIISDLKTIKNACGVLYTDTGKWPVGPGASLGLPIHASALFVPPDQTKDWSGNDYPRDDNMQGWEGPYLDQAAVANPWGGTYEVWNACRSTTNLCLHLNDYCYPSGPDAGCPFPDSAAQKIDEAIDDGDTGTGAFFKSATLEQCWWIMIEDVIY